MRALQAEVLRRPAIWSMNLRHKGINQIARLIFLSRTKYSVIRTFVDLDLVHMSDKNDLNQINLSFLIIFCMLYPFI